MRPAVKAQLLCLAALTVFTGRSYAVSSISIEIGQLESPVGQARNVSLDYRPGGALQAKGQIKAAGDKGWSNASLSCAQISNPKVGQWRCQDGKLKTERIQLPFTLAVTTQKKQGLQQLSAELSFKEASFSDAQGLHAGEKMSGSLLFAASQRLDANDPKPGQKTPPQKVAGWDWQGTIDWTGGELFWAPFYFANGGHHLDAKGQWSPLALTVQRADLRLKGAGQASVSGEYNLLDNQLETLKVDADNLDLAGLYPLVLKPLLEKTSLNNLEMAGKADLNLDFQHGEMQAFNLDLQNVDVEDKDGSFALYKLDATIPWDYNEARMLKLAYQGGHLLRLPLRQTALTAELNRYSVTAPKLTLPILDGELTLGNVSAAWVGGQWHWHLRAGLTALSMPELSHALGWPRMEGVVSARIPLVTYTYGNLSTDGTMIFNAFDGITTVSDLAMRNPLDVSPRLTANVRMRGLDLGKLTRTFSFGAIEGKLDGDILNLELVNWAPEKFDASFYSSPGRYPKKISQRAVENISSLGGAGAVAALQRSFLRFFKEFNYSQIGISCRLRDDKCYMDGIAGTEKPGSDQPRREKPARENTVPRVNNPAPSYVIVKGSGVPAITVLGYNHSVGWDDLLSRVRRITEGNKPVIK
ncbi:MAG TPA: hypothetical protein VFF74_01880 [Methylophilaceae bacterium]|nr:hypothetical protein [Methylophilaceae bacterium]